MVLTLRTTLVLILLALPSALWSVDSGNAAAHLGAGLKLFDVQRYSEASREFKIALEADPGLLDARYHLAVCDFNQRRFPEAREQLEHLSQAGYEKRWVSYYLGRINLIEGRPSEAIRCFQSLRSPEPLQDELYYLGSAFMKNSEPQKAIPPLTRQITLNPRDFRAHELIARAYVKVGRGKDADHEFAKAERLRNYYRQGKTQLTECRSQLQSGQADKAWAGCSPILQGDDIDLLLAAGMMFAEVGNYERALNFFHRAVELDPESPEINYDRADTLLEKGLRARTEVHRSRTR